MEIQFKHGLLYTSLEIIYKNKREIIDNIVIDTGAAHTIICPDAVSELGISASIEDEFITMYGIGGDQYAYRKLIDGILLGTCVIDEVKVDFGMIDEEGNINGLLGLDLLMRAHATIDLENLKITIGK